MTAKQTIPRGRQATAGARPLPQPGASRAKAAAETAIPMVRLSFSVEPLVSIVQRHVKVSEKARQAIAHDLAEALEHATVDMDVRQLPAEDDDPILTTEQAAQWVGVSRPFMAKLIDTGAVALHQKVGNQRRVRRSAVLRWQQAERSRQTQSLKRLAGDLDEEIFSS